MTDTGQVPAEGLPENAGMVEQPGAPAPGAYTFLDPSEHTAEDDDLLLMPGAQGAWSDPQVVPPSVAVPAQVPAQAQVPDAAQAQVQDPAQGLVSRLVQDTAQAQASMQVPAQASAQDPAQAFAPEGLPGADGLVAQAPFADHRAPSPEQPSPSEQGVAPVPPAEPAFAMAPGAPAADLAAEASVPGAHEVGGRDSGSVDLSGVRIPPPAPASASAQPQAAAPVRRPLHMGPPVPEPSVGVVRSLADRGPAGAATPPTRMPVRTPGPPTTGPEYFDVPRDDTAAEAPLPGPQLGEMPQAAEPWTPQPPQAQQEQQAREQQAAQPEQVQPEPAQADPVQPQPVQAEQAQVPGEPVQAVAPAEGAEPVAAVEPVEPLVAVGPSAPVGPAASGAQGEPVAEAGPVVAAEPTGPDASAVPVEPVEPGETPEAVAPAQSAVPEATEVPVETAEPVGAVEPVEIAEPAEAAEPSAAVESAEPVVSAEAQESTETQESAETQESTESQEVREAPESLESPEAAEQAEPVEPQQSQQTPQGPIVPQAPAAPAETVVPEPAAQEPVAPAEGEPEAQQAEQSAEAETGAQEPQVQEDLTQEPEPQAQPEAEAEAAAAVPAPRDGGPVAPLPEAEAEAQPQAPGTEAVVQVAEAPAEAVADAPQEPVTAVAPAPAPAPVAEEAPLDARPEDEQEAPTEISADSIPVVPTDTPADAPAEAVDPEAVDPGADAAPVAEQPADEQVGAPPAPGYDEAEREAVLRVMRERRDIRNGFRGDPIPHEVLLRVLEAAHTAPSVGHSQPWDFVVIRSAETRRTMHELATRQRDAYAKSLPKGRAKQFKELKIEAILDTPVNIVVTADPTRGGRHTLGRHTQPQMAPYSSALAVENLWLAARAEGLGVGWVSFFDEREMVRALGLPEHLEVVAYLCVGYVDEFPEEPELMQAGWSKRRPLSWVVHEETYGRRALPGEEPHDLVQETIAGIRPLDAKALGEAWERQKRMTKPAGALGMLEIISAQLSGLSRMCPPPIPEPAAVAIFAGDHGVHAQGVTAWPQEVTGQMVANFLGGGAVCNAFATQVGAEVCVIDVGVASDLPATPGLLPRKVRPGTADFTTGPALSREDVLAAIEVGIETARDLVAAGNKALLTGEMGIANTTVSAALIAVYTGVDPAEITGRGTGINDEMHARKVDVVRRALELHQPDPADPIGVLAAVGGLEHAAMVGLILGGASLRTPVILDGVSAGAAALVARAVAPESLAACIAGHRSAEPGHVAALNKLGLRPLVDLDLRLGEGTGALLALPVVQSAARAMHEVATFDSAGVTEK
ncbi:nicotinate-nucleotide--dimethylbenzimidazole phosphoribosyltransferase [Streptomyces sp. NPDC050504]|uniref:nicotinate-nucleotide--dimethylbenzimidazole phosphoribosyltransferase n=1 Tax=Streptomyces sp. NPDC050504 TaxID=3365618 RepID=UPI0037A27F2A